MFLETLIVAGAIILLFGLIFLKQGAPYVQTNDEDSKKILEIVKKNSPKYIVDIGSGDGKLVILLASHGIKADGIEINPLLVFKSKRAIKKAGLGKFAKIHWGSYWKHNLSKYDMAVTYAIRHIMPRLEKKLAAELESGSLVVSNFFIFPNLKQVNRQERIRVYKI